MLRGADLQPPSPIDMLQVLGLKGSTKLWVGKDYVNFIIKDFVDLDQPFTGGSIDNNDVFSVGSYLNISGISGKPAATCYDIRLPVKYMCHI